MAQTSGSRVYSPEYQQARVGSVPSRSIYVEREYSLDQYQREAPTSKWARRADESPEGYLQRTGAILRAIESLPEAEQKLIVETRDAIINAEPQSVQTAHDEVRKIIDQRRAADGVQQAGTRVNQAERFGHSREVAREGHLAAAASNLAGVPLASMSDVAAALRAAEEQFIPQRSNEAAAKMGAAR
jgi:hypothetical protein